MKTTKIYSLLLILCITTIFSCSKDSEDEVVISYGTMQAKIGPTTYVLRPVSPVYLWNGIASISGSNCTELVVISLKFLPEIGIYSIGNEDTRALLTRFDFRCGLKESRTDYTATEGSITVTESTTVKIKGTFNFIGESYEGLTATVTEGTFEIDY